MLLYPRLLHSEASNLARARATLTIEQARTKSGTNHPATVFAPTGGTRVRDRQLGELQRKIRVIAVGNGYPKDLDLTRQQQFDAQTAAALKSTMEISAAEAAQTGVWAFIACVLLPDLVRWRYPGSDGVTTSERFIGGSRGIRNTFGRLWWRAHLLGLDDDFSLLNELGEDELVQITERPVLAGNPEVARLFARRFVEYAVEFEELSRSDLMRDAIKRLRRLLSFLALELLTLEQLEEVVDGVLGDAAVALGIDVSRVATVARAGPPEVAISRTSETTSSSEPAGGDVRLEAIPNETDGLAAKLRDMGLEIIDKRDSGGCLWIVDEPDVEPMIERLVDHGYQFMLAESGSRSTDRRRAWFLPHDSANGEENTVEEEEATERATAGEEDTRDSTKGLQHMERWERGEFDETALKPDFQVELGAVRVQVIPGDNSASKIEWPLYDAGEALTNRLRNLAADGPEPTLLAIVATVFLHQQEFLEQGKTALYSLTLREVAEFLGTHESTVSRARNDVYVETPSGLLPLEYFFSPGVPHRSGRDISARAVRIHLRRLIDAEPPEAPFSDDELTKRLTGLGFSVARRTVAKYRDILGIPGAPSRKAIKKEAG